MKKEVPIPKPYTYDDMILVENP